MTYSAKLNVRLISTLTKVLRMTHNEISEATKIPIATWYRIVGDPQRITVPQLISLCNGLHIPVRRFFYTGRTHVVGVREDYIVSGYRPCRYDGSAVTEAIGRGTAITQREAAKVVGLHWSRINEYLRAERRLTVEQLLSFCQAFGFDPFQFLVDPNVENAVRSKAEAPNNAALTALMEEVRALREELQQVRSDHEKLKTAHNILVRRQQADSPQAHKRSGLSYDDTAVSPMPVAAEP